VHTTFGRYELVRRLAVGGMAEIFLARSASLDGFEKVLVIKKMRPDLSAEEQFFSMFIDEARITISFNHPNIVQVYDFGKADDSYYLALEYVPGCDVGALLRLEHAKEKGLPPGIALVIIGEVLKGLDYAHNFKAADGQPLNIVHRDISPANIMLSFEGGVKVGDFGIADATGRVSRTEPGMVMGKLSYMSPQHALGQVVDRRADVFSCGVVLWEMLVGKAPYGTVMDEAFFERVRTAGIPPPSSLRPELPAELDQLVARAVAQDPATRFATAREMGHAIHTYLVRHHPEDNLFTLQSFLEENRQAVKQIMLELGEDDDDESRMIALEAFGSKRTAAVPSLPNKVVPAFEWSEDLVNTIEAFNKHPSLWTIVRMGEICASEGRNDAAMAAFRVAAVKFAQAGLLAQCVLCCRRMLAISSFPEMKDEIASMAALHGQPDEVIAASLFHANGQMEQLLRELITTRTPRLGHKGSGTPLLSYLDGFAFAELVQTARLRPFKAGQSIVRQGDTGETMFLLCRGRVLVYATASDQQRIYLSSLSAGDFFGENAFFTSGRRSATVEALYDVDALEIDRALYDLVMHGNHEANNILLGFYKERIVETVMATSPTFGLLSNDDRRKLVAEFELRTFQPGELVIREGEIANQIYLVKDGIAEVFTEKGGPRTTLSEIGPGTIFGEVAALRRIPRTASVIAKTRLEALELSGVAFHAVLSAKPDIKQKILEFVAKRARDNMDKVFGGPSPFARNLN
jgi:serine/threonine protein kinase/CRP-like cAMP-binding protein